MSYIGRGLQSGAFRQLDDISSGFDGSDTTHTMQVNSTNVTVGDVNQILLSLGGVIQKPGTDFTVSSSVLTFTTAPAANTSFFAILLGSDNGGTVTPTDKSVTVGKIDINGGELFLDADDDTSITADTDDQIDIKIAGADDFQFTANTFTAQSGSTITTPTLGVGNTKDLGDGIHIKISDTGASTNTGFDELVIEKDSNCGISILSGNDDGGALIFGDDGDNDIGNIFYNHNGDYMAFNINAAERMRVSSAGRVGIATNDPTQALEINVDNTTAIVTNASIGSTNTDAANGLGIHNSNNSGVYSGIALETRTSGAARIALLNQYVSTYIGDLDFQFRNAASQNQNHVKFRASGEGEFYFGTELATDGTSPVNPVSSNSGGAEGFAIFAGSYMVGAINANPVMYLNRMTDDGNVLMIRAQGTSEGAISVSGSTVSFDAFTGSHWSRLEDNSKPTILKGTIMESLDKMMDWYQVSFTDQNNQKKVWAISLPEGGKVGDDYEIADPHVEDIKYVEVDIFYTDEDTDIPEGKKIGDRKPGMDGKSVGDIKIARPVYTGKIVKEGDVKHVYSKVSDTADSKKVYGLFFDWDDDDTGDDGDVNDFRVAQVGTYIIRVNKDVTVEAGDLLVSNGDGTAKKQDDDIIRSKTVAKVNSNIKVETYSDGSYTVPCTLHC
jgi:hypothetical protein